MLVVCCFLNQRSPLVKGRVQCHRVRRLGHQFYCSLLFSDAWPTGRVCHLARSVVLSIDERLFRCSSAEDQFATMVAALGRVIGGQE